MNIENSRILETEQLEDQIYELYDDGVLTDLSRAGTKLKTFDIKDGKAVIHKIDSYKLVKKAAGLRQKFWSKIDKIDIQIHE